MNPDRARELLTTELKELDDRAEFAASSAAESASGDLAANEGGHSPSTRPTSAPRSRTGWRARGSSAPSSCSGGASRTRWTGSTGARYGRCAVCGTEIDDERLEARPEVATCREHADALPVGWLTRRKWFTATGGGKSPGEPTSARDGGNRRLPRGPGPGGPHRAGAHAAAPRPGLQLPRRVRRGDHRPRRDRPAQGAGDPACLAGRVDQPGPAGPHPGRRHRRRGPAPVPLPRGVAAGPRRASSTTGC